ncbi:hypothetical protein ATO6_13885 [Oceanicola sp. 22II-s10i]|uniref:enoyl-CoA hydratase/isomerase family protein n=1 Tax=Oceanicola sp. 22II-s10i TaxID=1317116 RepID=UPI000B521811|nr:enoyl-CoA hydratase/isomerase family protein [Oceanicola sp. 22II-s10i]OWU84148.1 hypothetical protein ATO6_13885 [Oceanicola sp. 22II-s10i]
MSNEAPLDAAGLRDTARLVREWRDVARLWDVGADAAVFEFCGDMALVTPPSIEALDAAFDRAGMEFGGLVLTSDSPRCFVFGAGGPFRDTILTGDAGPSLRFLIDGQSTLMRLRDAPCPVVAAIHGGAYSGGCEIALFANGLAMERDATFALREIWMGLIPGWGGVCQLMLRRQAAGDRPWDALEGALTAYARGVVSEGAAAARAAHVLRAGDRDVAGRADLIPAALARCEELAGMEWSEQALALPGPEDADRLSALEARLTAELDLHPWECAALAVMTGLIRDHLGQQVPESTWMSREAAVFPPLLSPALGARFAHVAAKGTRPPRDTG